MIHNQSKVSTNSTVDYSDTTVNELYTLVVPQLVMDVQISPTGCKMGRGSHTTCLGRAKLVQMNLVLTCGDVYLKKTTIYNFS
jgi:hypothetical protein